MKREICRRWRTNHPEKNKEAKENYRSRPENKVKERMTAESYRLANLVKFALQQHKRRARVHKVGGTFTIEQWKQRCEEYHYLCAYCRKPDCKLTVDHMVPIIRGGSNDIENIAPACQSCNSKKGKMTAQEFLTR